MPGSELRVEFRAGAPFELLIALSAPGADIPAAVRRVGDQAGETWLHLLGLALESHALDAASFVEEVAGVDPLEFRRHVLGAYVPAWRTVAGAETIERAARGDAAAVRDLLANDRYYAGRAAESLGVALPLTPHETKKRFVAALRAFARVFARREHELVEVLESDARRRRTALVDAPPETAIAAATSGYVYEREPEFVRVVLIPHLAAAPSLLLCQHRDTRIICYPAERPGESADVVARAVRLGKALSDPVRVAIVRTLAERETSLTELATTVGIAKSTAHHHLATLRAAGLVTLRGNARGYWYTLRLEGLADARSLLGELVSSQ